MNNDQTNKTEQHQSRWQSEWVYIAIGFVFIVLAVIAIARPKLGAEPLWQSGHILTSGHLY